MFEINMATSLENENEWVLVREMDWVMVMDENIPQLPDAEAPGHLAHGTIPETLDPPPGAVLPGENGRDGGAVLPGEIGGAGGAGGSSALIWLEEQGGAVLPGAGGSSALNWLEEY